MSDEWISPTEEETLAVKKAVADAVLPIIKPIMSDDDYQVAVRRILSAVKVMDSLIDDAEAENKLKHEGKKVHSFWINKLEIARACIAAISDDREEVIFDTIGMYLFDCYASAARIIAAASELESAMDCDNCDYGWAIAHKAMKVKS